jgi:hypothetical protein
MPPGFNGGVNIISRVDIRPVIIGKQLWTTSFGVWRHLRLPIASNGLAKLRNARQLNGR